MRKLRQTFCFIAVLCAPPGFAEESARNVEWTLESEIEHYENFKGRYADLYAGTLKLYQKNPHYRRQLEHLSRVLRDKSQWVILQELKHSDILAVYSVYAWYFSGEGSEELYSWKIDDGKKRPEIHLSKNGDKIDKFIEKFPNKFAHWEFIRSHNQDVVFITVRNSNNSISRISAINPGSYGDLLQARECSQLIPGEKELKKFECSFTLSDNENYKIVSKLVHELQKLDEQQADADMR